MPYVEPGELAAQLKYRTADDPRLTRVITVASDAIDHWCGRTDPFADPVPPAIVEVALALAIDLWKQPDASFGIIGLGETGPVRVARDLVARYDAALIPFYDPLNGWGVA